MVEVIPAIMPQTLDSLQYDVALVAHYVKTVQLDIMDGTFVRPKTWPYQNNKGTFDSLINESEGMPFWDKVDFEIDLLIAHPENSIEQWIAAGATRIVVHVESTTKIEEIIKDYKDRVDIILSLNVDTSLDKILPYLEDIHGIQFMGIAKIGYQGEPFDERVVDKIREFHNAHPDVIISVDGGVNEHTAAMLVEIGVKRLVSGSAIFESGNIPDAIDWFQNL